MIRIRNAESSDVGAVGELLHATWHDTYDALIGPQKVDEITARWHAAEVLVCDISNPHAVFLIAEDEEGRVVGHLFAQRPSSGEAILRRLYVLPSEQRRGAGSALLEGLVARLSGRWTLRLEVEAQNEKGRRFYEKHGFEVVGHSGSCGGDSDVPSLLMQKQFLS